MLTHPMKARVGSDETSYVVLHRSVVDLLSVHSCITWAGPMRRDYPTRMLTL
jgi:hypothetical protein